MVRKWLPSHQNATVPVVQWSRALPIAPGPKGLLPLFAPSLWGIKRRSAIRGLSDPCC